jgi:hypothetical protein
MLAVCAEESLAEVRSRYIKYNAHALSYTWKRLGRSLNMELTLEENGRKTIIPPATHHHDIVTPP